MKTEEAQIIHDLKNKLLVIQHHYSKLDESLALSKDYSKNHEPIERSLDRCFELIASYADQKGEKVEHEVALLSDVINEGSMPHYEELEKMYNLKINVSYDFDGASEGLYLKGNHDRFKKVRENIVENAVNAKASYLNVTIRGKKDHIEATYENDGDPISEKLKSQINNIQYGKTINAFKNIGTKIIKQICREHGFSVTYDSSDVGTRITLIMPYFKP